MASVSTTIIYGQEEEGNWVALGLIPEGGLRRWMMKNDFHQVCELHGTLQSEGYLYLDHEIWGYFALALRTFVAEDLPSSI